MQRTIAEEMKEVGRHEGEVQARQQTLLRLLKRRFGDIPPATASAISACIDVEQLDSWLDAFATADSLDQVAIASPRSATRAPGRAGRNRNAPRA